MESRMTLRAAAGCCPPSVRACPRAAVWPAQLCRRAASASSSRCSGASLLLHPPHGRAPRRHPLPRAAGADSALPPADDASTSGAAQPPQQQPHAPPAPPPPTPQSSGGGGLAGNVLGALAAAAGLLAGLSLLMFGGYLLREPIKAFLNFFITAVDEWGLWGYVAYALVYAGLEVLAMPAAPLTMTAGAIFGPAVGTGIVLVSATLAATIAFLISRYVARDRIMAFAQRNKRFAAIDRAISRDGLKFVTLLRLSPLLPLALSNWFYGLTSVDLGSYVIGSFFGMMPGTYAYVTAGHLGKAMLVEGGGAGAGLAVAPWQVGAGVGASVLAVAFIGQLAKRAVEEADAEAAVEGGGSGGAQQPAQQQQLGFAA
ncbi:MAG: snare associated Golgi protein-domain-containing protein [Monoraphidium minutum]|nr:MAG: snare associated Golgi protein-domain-containing protein [Monoraphidium minutum]